MLAGKLWSEQQAALFSRLGRVNYQLDALTKEKALIETQLGALDMTASLAQGLDDAAAKEAEETKAPDDLA